MKYKFSREWHKAEIDIRYYDEINEWCSENFGPHPAHPDAWSRWWHRYENSILLRDKEDYLLFILRWS